MKIRKTRLTQIILTVFFISFLAISDTSAQVDVGVDFTSRYLWRGQLLAAGPAIQPGISFTKEFGNSSIKAGVWGSYGWTGNDGSEADLYLTYSIGDFSVTLTDYFFPSDVPFAGDAASDSYFHYGETTGHIFEAGFGFDRETVPVTATLYYNFAGADPQNSLYAELGYKLSDQLTAKVAAGNGFYTTEQPTQEDQFSIVTFGLEYSKEIPISEKFSLPVTGKLSFNPNLEKFYIVFAFSL